MQNERDEEASAGVEAVGIRGELVDMVYRNHIVSL